MLRSNFSRLAQDQGREPPCACGLMGKTSPGTTSSKGEFGLNKNTREIGAVLWLALSACWVAAQTASEPEKRGPIVYPVAKKVDIVDDYHGMKVADPYRWLEDSDSPETVAWVAAENRITMTYLDSIPARPRIKERLTTLYNYERYAGLHKEGGRYFFQHNAGLQNQDVLHVAQTLVGKQRVLLDPNTLRTDGTAALKDHVVSPDGKLLAYAIGDAGSDWSEWHIREVDTGKDLPDLIRWSKFFSVCWTPDDRAFYYLRFPEPKTAEALTASNFFSKLYLHRVGEPQSADKLVYDRPDQKQWMFAPEISDDRKYLIMSVNVGDFGKNLLFYQNLRAKESQTIELIRELNGRYDFIGNQGTVFYLLTTNGAPRGRIVAVDVSRPAPERWKEVIAQQNESMDVAQFVNGKFVVSYTKDVFSEIKIYRSDGRLIREVPLPGIGRVEFAAAHQRDSEVFFSFSSFTSPEIQYRLDLGTNKSTPVQQSRLSFDPSRYEIQQIFYASKDGTRIPMSLVYRKGMNLDGRNPTVLYGYGGFNVNIPGMPIFQPWYIAWMNMGGLVAVANLRGGGEYGEEWHQAGKQVRKQNVFDDFIAGAEWLIASHYSSTPKLGIFGRSNGGLLIGACLNQRPDLFGAAMPAVGVMDMLRFQKFTVGAEWVDEYGSSDNAADFRILRAYSPLHNIQPGTHYPATLIWTADHDDRVVPGHSFKYAAALQEAQGGRAPILIRIETRAGHGLGTPVSKLIDEFTDRLAFLTRELSVTTEQ